MPTNINGNGSNADFSATVQIPENGDPVEIPTFWEPTIQELADRSDFLKERFGGFELRVLGWRIEDAIVVDSFDVSTQETAPTGVAFRDNGTRMFVVGSVSDSVHQYDLSTAWDVSTAVFVSSFDVSAQDTIPNGVAFRDNGTRMYVVGFVSDSVHQYDLSTAWDVSTAVFVSSFDVLAQETTTTGVAFSDDGTRMYVVGVSSDSVHQYDLSTAWDVSTAVFVSSFDVSAQDTTPSGVAFRDDGTRMFVVGSSSDSVHRYDLSTAWDVTTASFVSSFDVSAQDTSPNAIAFSSSGLDMFIAGGATTNMYSFTTNRVVAHHV